MRIVFHGANASTFHRGFAEILGGSHEVLKLADLLASDADRAIYSSADILVGTKFDASLPAPPNLKLYHVPAAGYDAIDMRHLPLTTPVCNCFGHEQAIAEYVMSAILARHIPLADADRRLRQGDWTWWAGAPERVHGEIAGTTIGLLGFGHIGKAIARRAKAFEMTVNVANRSTIAPSALVDRAFTLGQLNDFCGSADFIVTSLPLEDSTRGIVGAAALSAMRPDGVIINVGRGPIIDEQALFDALEQKRIGGAIIDTWYVYPSQANANPQPARLPFNTLQNVLMTPHMSGWTKGTITRRQRTIADNINRLATGQPLLNIVRAIA